MDNLGKVIGSGSQGIAVEYNGKIVKIMRRDGMNDREIKFFKDLYERYENGKEVIDSLPRVYDFYEGTPSNEFRKWLEDKFPNEKSWEEKTMVYWIIDKAETVGSVNKFGLSNEDITIKLDELIDWTWLNMKYFLADLNSSNYGFKSDGTFFVFDPKVYEKFPKDERSRKAWKFGFSDKEDVKKDKITKTPLGMYHENFRILEYNSFLSSKIDSLLDKISKDGIESLTKHEIEFLDAQNGGVDISNDALVKLKSKENEFTYKSDDGTFTFHYKESKKSNKNGGFMHYGIMELPNIVDDNGNTIDGTIKGYILEDAIGTIATRFLKGGYTDFDFSEGFEYEYDEFVQELIIYINEHK